MDSVVLPMFSVSYANDQRLFNAYGFKQLYKSLPVGKAEFFWTKIKGIGSKSTYYRKERGQITISPELQEQILALAKECGAPDGVEFDEYREEIKI